MLNLLAALFTILAIAVFLMIIWLIPSLLRGGVNILLPGLGLVVSGWFALAFLILIELVLVALVVILMR